MSDQLTTFAYAAARDPFFPVAEGIAELRRLGASWLPPIEATGTLGDWIAAIRAGDDDGREFPPERWRRMQELLDSLVLLLEIEAADRAAVDRCDC